MISTGVLSLTTLIACAIVVDAGRRTPAVRPAEPLQETPSEATFDLPPPSSILPAGDGPAGGSGGGSGGRRPGDLPAMPFKLRTSDRHGFDLSLPEHREDLLKALNKEPMPLVVDVYGRIRQLARSQPKTAADRLRSFLGSITTESRKRGFFPRDNEVDSECLRYVRLDPWNIMNDEPLQRRDKEVDVRPIVQPLYDVEPGIRRTFAERMKGFVIEALRTIDSSLGEPRTHPAGQRHFVGDDDHRHPLQSERLHDPQHFMAELRIER